MMEISVFVKCASLSTKHWNITIMAGEALAVITKHAACQRGINLDGMHSTLFFYSFELARSKFKVFEIIIIIIIFLSS